MDIYLLVTSHLQLKEADYLIVFAFHTVRFKSPIYFYLPILKASLLQK
jgi:hypothetical protein